MGWGRGKGGRGLNLKKKKKRENGERQIDEAMILHFSHGKFSPYPANKSQAVLQWLPREVHWVPQSLISHSRFITLYTFQWRPYVTPRHKEIGTPPTHCCSVLYLFGICQAPYLPYNSQSSHSLSTLLVVRDKGAKGKTLYTLITNLDSFLRGEVSTQAVNPDDYLGIQVRTPCKPCCIVRYLIYILLYVLARFAIWINEWIKIIMIQFII